VVCIIATKDALRALLRRPNRHARFGVEKSFRFFNCVAAVRGGGKVGHWSGGLVPLRAE
jgi:hypothetical protein